MENASPATPVDFVVMPRLITRKQVAREVKDRFRAQYGPAFRVYPFGDSAAIYEDLVALGDDPSIEDVEALCKGWTRVKCDECGQDVYAVVQLGEQPDNESSTASVCGKCLLEALKIIQSA